MVTDTEFSGSGDIRYSRLMLRYFTFKIRPQHMLDDLPKGKKVNFVITCKLAPMQMTNRI